MGFNLTWSTTITLASLLFAPLTTLALQPKDQVVLFDPPLQGTGEWLNTSLYRFTPDPANVRPFTKYGLRVPAKVSPDEDGSLRQFRAIAFDFIAGFDLDYCAHDAESGCTKIR